MSADVLLSIGISTDEAKRGHDQIIAYNNDIAASFAKVTQQQSASTAKIVQDEQKKADATVKSARERISVEERAAAAIMAGYVRQGQAMGAMGNSANQTSLHFSNMRGIIGQAGLQISDLAIVSQMGAQSIGQMGIQVGQFLGVLGPMGALAGAAVTILGVLAGTYFNLSKNTEDAADAQEKFDDAIKSSKPLIQEYLSLLDQIDGRSSKWRSDWSTWGTATEKISDQITDIERKMSGVDEKGKAIKGWAGLSPSEFRDLDVKLAQLKAEKDAIDKSIKQVPEMRNTQLIDDMASARKKELDIAELANNSREREAKILDAVSSARDKLKNSGLSTTEIEAQVKLEADAAGRIYDLEEQRKAREKSTREADTERKRQMSEMTRETERTAEAQKKARGSVDEYITSMNRQREVLGMSERDGKIYMAGLEARDRLEKSGIKNVEELAAAQEKAGKTAAALYDDQQVKGKVLSRDQIRSMAAQFSPEIAYQLQVQNSQKYQEELIKEGVTAQQIADAEVEANMRKLESSREWTDGATAALMRYSRDASNYSAAAGRVVSNSMSSMENALVSFSMKTTSASEAFKKMASSIIEDLIRMQVRASITGPLSNMLTSAIGSMFSSYSFSSGSIDTSSMSTSYMGSTMSGGGYEMAFASGTDYAPSGMALVGEEGPELVQLGGGERIYPAGETAAILSGKAANGNPGGGGSMSIAEGAIVVNAPGASAEDAAIIAQQVATAVVQQAAPQIVRASVKQSLSASKSAADRGGSYAQAMGRR